ncbi:MAG: helix-turn-helix domain-containing protein [Acidobacteria bacterium]|nr:helix-turn-helix domain-containing protein [Acidobacteriota bacterium]
MATNEQATPDFGVRMRHLREERGVTLRQIADVTRISISALEALERNDISRLPGGIFSRAFVRSYAIEVGLDPEETVLAFLAQFPHDTVIAGSPHAAELQGAPSAARRGRSFWIVVILLVLGGIVLIALGALR